jgi:DEAD/DEAH box helicase domain-containing protein
MFKKVRFRSRDSLGFEQLELPPQSMETVAMWIAPPDEMAHALLRSEMLIGEALIGIANVLVEVAPFFVMCDTRDIGAVVDNSCLGHDALFLYDRYPGGMGYAQRCLDLVEDIVATIHDVVRECGCDDGCPSCVGSATPPFAQGDLDSSVRGRIPNKAAAELLLRLMLADGSKGRK